ncbi:MAG: DMT family transporter [Bacteroidetes bacterium]|nr:DMT family transporter [Bacteroidota bacterium]
MNSKTKAHIAVLIANLIFGAGYAVIKTITPAYLAPYSLNVVRVVVSLILFWSLLLFKPSKASIDKKDIPLFVLCGITGVAINQIMFVKGLSLTSAIHSSLLSLATPIFITIIALWLIKEKFSINKFMGLALGIGGATLLVLVKDVQSSNSSSLLGDMFVLINAVSYAFYMVIVRPLMEKYNALHVLRWVFTFGAIFILPIALPDFIATDWSVFGTAQWVALAFVVLFVTFISYLFTVYGLQELGPSVTGAYIYTQPVFATIIAMVFAGEHFTMIKALAAVLIFSGVYLVNRKKAI